MVVPNYTYYRCSQLEISPSLDAHKIEEYLKEKSKLTGQRLLQYSLKNRFQFLVYAFNISSSSLSNFENPFNFSFCLDATKIYFKLDRV